MKIIIRVVAGLTFLPIAVAPIAAQMPAGRATSPALVRAKAALDSGLFERAEALYDTAIKSSNDKRDWAQGYFGRAYSIQRRLLSDRDSLSVDEAQQIAYDYRQAATFDLSLAAAAASNRAVALQAAGLKTEAVDALRQQTFAMGRGGGDGWMNLPIESMSVSTLLRMGNAFMAQGQNDSARVYFTRARRIDTTSSDVLRAKLLFEARTNRGDSVLTLARTTLSKPAAAPVVEDALLSVLESGPARGRIADSTWILCVRTWATMRLTPASFALSEDGRLRAILAKNPDAKSVVQPMLDAYRPREGTSTFRDTSSWWRANESRRAAWSRMLRSIGDGYNESDNTSIAASYYEAAIGMPDPALYQGWVDLDALLPLALIYAHQAEGRPRADELVQRVNQLTEMLFVGKMRAIESADYQRIRKFHLTLGTLFAAQGKWSTPNDPRGAIYQLESMRRMTTKANQVDHTTLTDPPELLEKLAVGYQAIGQTAKAQTIAKDVVTAYKRQGKSTDAARIAARFKIVSATTP